MRLIRFGEPGLEEPGVLLADGRMVDASGEFKDYDEAFFSNGGMKALREWVDAGCPGGLDIPPNARMGPPIARPSKIVCIGKNYLDHAKEFGEGIPTEPILFMKASSCWSGPHDDVIRPRGSEKLDYEVELAVVIGCRATDLDEIQALDCIAGYSVFCDYSERAFQKEMGGQWTKGKSADTFGPMGPCLVTPDEIADPHGLRLWCKVNTETRQNGWTGDMMFRIPFLISYISRFMTLLPGDVIATGTPSGVAMGMEIPRYLVPGDAVECGIEGIGELRQRVVPAS
jgi:2,4-diketo-3-deoxy-L-fuconate hydrolase